ncbi:vanadium-dependent haloperoxidase [Adhaeribacter rhizoryzae]|uniref:Vanadium-dependent haloperoxidase n=1 Tax=Adhaeribacter rhizoryzae TaxID=2607907 RepID=A0A5M6DS37_9BACT|nr:vanadium-dependent haloperoxidase [Adhaeribacter rhizoryzae]KAA5549136.1 vanadium-dependent haloperoxidase [Adhaeribacter rhizoryzae]
MRIFIFQFLLGLTLFLTACEEKHNQAGLDAFSNTQLEQWNKNLSEIIIKDIFSPPVASRIYAYANIAAYEALVPAYPDYQSLSGQLHKFAVVPQPEAAKEYYFPVASMKAFSTVCKKLTLVPENTEDFENAYLEQLKKIGIRQEVLENSLAYGEKVGQHVLAWAAQDNYLESRALTRHMLSETPESWQPTPPDYMPAVEPHWNTIRPFVMDSAAQCKPLPPTPFDSLPGSKFYQEAYEIYKYSKEQENDKVFIARFWDDNPNVSFTKGHVTFFKQKLTPGGHWLSIATTAIKDKKLNLMQAAETYVLVSTALADGFISCWDAKYKYTTIRPETYIEKYIDQDWDPIIQTPPFPEFPSGHSVISAAAATTLTHLFGDNYAFTDSTQLVLGLPVRKFKSFYEASNEAGLSRMYGGIHFQPANELGARQGREVGTLVTARLKTRRSNQIAKF